MLLFFCRQAGDVRRYSLLTVTVPMRCAFGLPLVAVLFVISLPPSRAGIRSRNLALLIIFTNATRLSVVDGILPANVQSSLVLAVQVHVFDVAGRSYELR